MKTVSSHRDSCLGWPNAHGIDQKQQARHEDRQGRSFPSQSILSIGLFLSLRGRHLRPVTSPYQLHNTAGQWPASFAVGLRGPPPGPGTR